jgi:hypothetical protein
MGMGIRVLLGCAAAMSIAALSAACGDDEAASGASGGGGSGADSGSGAASGGAGGSDGQGGDGGGGAVPPPDACDRPITAADTSGARLVGDGTPESCTEAALGTAIDDPGASAITFDCGAAPHTLTVTSEKVVARALIIDGGGAVTLSGGGTTRILRLAGNHDDTAPLLTVQNLTFRDGYTGDLDGGDVDSGGAAIHRLGGSLHVIDSTFHGNAGPETGQDVAGGAVYSRGIGETIIVGSVFYDNACSSGGAVGFLQSQMQIVNTSITSNAATGNGGNPGNGGNGGGIYMDGVNQSARLCGVIVSDNTANARGGGMFRVSNNDVGPMDLDRTTVENNIIGDNSSSQAGGLYLQGLQIVMTSTTVAGNAANSSGGIFVANNPSATTLDMTNVTIAGNHARTSLGAGLSVASSVTGSLSHVTIMENSNEGATSFASALNGGDGLTIKNSLFADQSQVFLYENISCNVTHSGEGANMQWPELNNNGDAERACTDNVSFADPLLGPLQDNGGPTPTAAPAAGSPAIGAGVDCEPFDQRGEPRAASCTLGAVEP